MKLEFNNINEIIDFLKEIGYTVEKNLCCPCKTDEKTLTINDKDLKEIWKDDWWKNPYQPYYPTNIPTYPYQPITTFDAQNDPELSKKFVMNNTQLKNTDKIELNK